MTTAEKLVSLFQRKKSIIEHVKQRVDSYNQHLASKFLVEEIDPPSWFRASGSKELNEEELISKLLRQYPQSSVPWSVARYPGHINTVSAGDHVENLGPNKNIDQNNDHADDAGCSDENNGECMLNTVPELDASAASPEDHTDEKILNIYNAADQSLARIQRSKSRQKALELHSSAKAPGKSGLRHESSSDVVSGQIRFSPSITNQPGQHYELSTLGEPCTIGSQGCENRNVYEARRLSREMGVDAHSERLIRSETYAEVPVSAVGSIPLGCSSEDSKKNTSSQDGRVRREETMPISDTEHADNHVNKSPKSAGPSAVSCQSFRAREEENATPVCKDEGKNVYTGEITRSEVSSRRQSCGCDTTKADKSSDGYQGVNITVMDSEDDLPPDCVDGSPMKINLSNVRQEGCGARESVLEDSGRYKERDVFPSSSSIQFDACINEISDLEVPSASAKVYGGTLALSSAGSAKQVNDSQELSGLVKLSDGLFRSVSRSETHSYGKETNRPVTYDENPRSEGTKSFSDHEEKSAEELPNSSGQSVPPCIGTHKMLHDDKNGKLVMASELDNKGCDSQESVSEDSGRCKERDVNPSSSSIQYNACIHETFDLEVPSASVQIYGGIPTPSSAGSAKQLNDSIELSGLVKPSDGLFCSVTRSETHSYGKETYQSVTHDENPSFEGTKSFSDCDAKSAEKLQKSIDQSVPPCPETHKMIHDDKNGKPVMASDLCLLDPVDKSCLSMSKYSKQSRGLESEVALTPLDSFVSMEHKQLMLKDTEEYNLKAFTSRSGEKMSYSLHDPDVSLDKGTCGGSNQPSLSRQIPWMSDIPSKGERVHMDSLEPDVQESQYTHVGIFGPAIGSTMSNAFNYSSEAELNCRSSEVQHETHHVLSKLVDITDIQNPPMKLLVKHGLKSSSPVHCMEQGHLDDEASDKDQQVSSSPESKSSRLSYGHNSADIAGKSYGCSVKKTGTNQIAMDEIKQYTGQQSQILSWSEDEDCNEHEDSPLTNNSLGVPSTITLDAKSSSLERILRHVGIESWPQVKRRKNEHQQTHGFATSQSFRVTKPQTFQRDPGIIFPKTMEIDVDTGVMEHVDKSTDDGICSEVNTNLMEVIQSAILSQHGEVGSCYIEKSEHKLTSAGISNEQLVAATISSVGMKESRNSQGCFIDGTRTSPSSCEYVDARMSGDKQFSQNLCLLKSNADKLSSESLNLSCTLDKEIHQSLKWEDGLQLQHSVLSLGNEDPQLTDVDQSMPVFEKFALNAQTDSDELDFDLCKLDLPTTNLERVSMLAEICRSASLDRPSSHFSSAFKFQETSNLCKSLSNDGHLDHMEFGNNYPLIADLGINFQSRSSSSVDYTDALDGMPYSVSLTSSGERYGWNSRNQPPSPVGKLWNRLSSHTGSSGKCSTSNPELTCFPIEEDPSSGEENKTMEENAGETLDETDSSLGNCCDKSQPLKDLTNMGTNPPLSVSAEEGTFRADSVDILSSKSVTRTQEKTFLGPKYQTSCTRAADGRKHLTSYIGSNAIKRTKESVKGSIGKPSVSNKTSLKGQDQNLSLRESRTNNIVSNVRSFIPLIQQKQAATAACTGKRDVKVKALETAEAAKRLMEKKANERNQRKEALKFERAAKNLKHMELENKKKEEERKKKNADIAKKRLREDEEKKEKEKKRLRLDPRQQLREQEEKKRVERHEKEIQLTKNDQLNRKKGFNNESKRRQNEETTREEGMALQKTDPNLTFNEVVVNHEECGTSGRSCDGEVMHAVDKSPRNENLIVRNNQGKSYDISPYRSDDEDEEDDELPVKKYIPSWASKTSVSLLIPWQQKLDPDVIFPPNRFCSSVEITQKQKQVVASSYS